MKHPWIIRNAKIDLNPNSSMHNLSSMNSSQNQTITSTSMSLLSSTTIKHELSTTGNVNSTAVSASIATAKANLTSLIPASQSNNSTSNGVSSKQPASHILTANNSSNIKTTTNSYADQNAQPAAVGSTSSIVISQSTSTKSNIKTNLAASSINANFLGEQVLKMNSLSKKFGV
jgi:hypothetical protein